jgi:hypothetical protein
MTLAVTPLDQPDLNLADLRRALTGHEAVPLVLTYAGRTIQPGYHVTEIKSAQLSALDCGGNPDSWTEAILQVEDIPGPDSRLMTVGKFLSILGRVERALALAPSSRVTIEISRPAEAMQVFDIGGIDASPERLTLALALRPAICKPRHRALDAARSSNDRAPATSCCQPSAGAAACCA